MVQVRLLMAWGVITAVLMGTRADTWVYNMSLPESPYLKYNEMTGLFRNGVTHMGTYSKEIQVLWEMKDRLQGSWTCSLINLASFSSRPAPWQGSVGASAIGASLWSLNCHFGDFVFHAESLFHSKDEWAMTSLPTWKCIISVWTAGWNNCGGNFALQKTTFGGAAMGTLLSGLRPICKAGLGAWSLASQEFRT